MKRARIGINGFGRIRPADPKGGLDWPEFDWALVNEVKGGAACAAHLMNFDSLQGRWTREASAPGRSDRRRQPQGRLRRVCQAGRRAVVRAWCRHRPRVHREIPQARDLRAFMSGA